VIVVDDRPLVPHRRHGVRRRDRRGGVSLGLDDAVALAVADAVSVAVAVKERLGVGLTVGATRVAVTVGSGALVAVGGGV
jgi:hypothetical protein